MVAQISVSMNLGPFRRWLDGVAKNQIPFATAKALTQTGYDAQEAVKRELPARFTIRTPWLAKGIRVIPAKKFRLQAIIGSKDEFMRRQEEGGEKEPRSGHKVVAIPKGVRSNPRTITRPSRFPGALLKKPKYFVSKLESGDLGVFQRLGRKGEHVKLMYSMRDKVTVKPRWHFYDTVNAVVSVKWLPNFRRALDFAMRTARR